MSRAVNVRAEQTRGAQEVGVSFGVAKSNDPGAGLMKRFPVRD